jgi:FkbM family methyltransferase
MDIVEYDCNINGDWFRFQDLKGSETIPLVVRELNRGEYGINSINLNRDDIFLDVGANIGIVSIYVAKKFGCKVIAFEPMSENVENFKANIKLNGLSLSDFEIHQNAVSSKDGEILKIGFKHLNTGACSIYYNELVNTPIEVKTISLNKFITPEVKYLKMDCEGSEYEIIPTIKNLLGGLKYIGIEFHQLVEGHDVFHLYSQLRESFQGEMFIETWDNFSNDLTQRLRDFDKSIYFLNKQT